MAQDDLGYTIAVQADDDGTARKGPPVAEAPVRGKPLQVGVTMELLRLGMDLCAGWCVWSLAHNLGHRWWHDEMLKGKVTFYAHGEREHHRIYDRHGENRYHIAEDPKELFISFPLPVIAPVGLVFVALYGWLCGWSHAGPFAGALYISMVLDHQLHILFHKKTRLSGPLGWFQQMHLLHHATHNKNYFFVSGLPWDVIFGTARLRPVTRL
jgi:hypothetical protein